MTIAEMMDHDWLKGVNVSDLPIAGSDRRLYEFEDARRRLKAKLIGMMIVTARATIQSNKTEEEELQKPKKVMAFQSNADRRKVTDLQQELQVVSQSFNVFDRERKGFISAKDMQRALKDAGDTSNVSEEELQGMIRATCNRDNFEYEDYKVLLTKHAITRCFHAHSHFYRASHAHSHASSPASFLTSTLIHSFHASPNPTGDDGRAGANRLP
jgi:hypothetical protein